MQLFVLFLAGVVCFVSLDVGGAEESSPVLVSSDQHPLYIGQSVRSG